MKKFSSWSKKTKGIVSMSLVFVLVLSICFGTTVMSARPDEDLSTENLLAPKDPSMENSTGPAWKPYQDSTEEGTIALRPYFQINFEDAKEGTKSLKVTPGGSGRLFLNPVLKSNTWYEFSFWAKKTDPNGKFSSDIWYRCAGVSYEQFLDVTEATTDWTEYSVEIYVPNGYEKLDAWNGFGFDFSLQGGTEILIDDIQLKEIVSNIPTPLPTPSPSPTISPTPVPTPEPTPEPTEAPVVKVKKVKLNKKKVTLKVKKSIKLKATVTPKNAVKKKVTWKSSKSKIAKVNKKGKVTGVKPGKAKITAKTKNGKKAVCKVTVKKAKKKK